MGRGAERGRGSVPLFLSARSSDSKKQSALVDHFVHGGLLVAGARHNVLVVRRDVTAQDGRGFLGLFRETKRFGVSELKETILVWETVGMLNCI